MKALECLPPELLEHIATYINDVRSLRHCVKVNKRFYRMLTPKLWHSPRQLGSAGVYHSGINLLSHCLTINSNQHHRIDSTPLGHHIRKLELARNDSVSDFLLVLALTPQVEELCLDQQQRIRDNDMERLFQLCPQIKTLVITYIHITDKSFVSLGVHCRQLRRLTLAKLNALTPKTLVALKGCPLERLRINHCLELTLTPDTASHLASFHTLTSLYLQDVHRGVDTDFIRLFIPRANEPAPLYLLKHLSLTGDANMDDNVMAAFLRAHPQLQTLSLTHCHLRDAALDAIATHLPCLTSLRIDQKGAPSRAMINQVILRCRRLVAVVLCFRNDIAWQVKRMDQAEIRLIRLVASN